MKFVNIGFGNFVALQRIVAVISPDSAPVRRTVQEARERGALIDASFGRSTRAVIVADNGNVILSSLTPAELTGKASDEKETDYYASQL